MREANSSLWLFHSKGEATAGHHLGPQTLHPAPSHVGSFLQSIFPTRSPSPLGHGGCEDCFTSLPTEVALIGGPLRNCCFSGLAVLRLHQGREGSFRYHDLSRPFPLAAFVPTATARTGAHHTTTRCIWAPRRPPASTAARGRGTRCTGKEGPRMAKAGCIPERPPSSQWAGTGTSLALMEQELQRDFSVSLPHLPCARYPLLKPRATCLLHLQIPMVCSRP